MADIGRRKPNSDSPVTASDPATAENSSEERLLVQKFIPLVRTSIKRQAMRSSRSSQRTTTSAKSTEMSGRNSVASDANIETNSFGEISIEDTGSCERQNFTEMRLIPSNPVARKVTAPKKDLRETEKRRSHHHKEKLVDLHRTKSTNKSKTKSSNTELGQKAGAAPSSSRWKQMPLSERLESGRLELNASKGGNRDMSSHAQGLISDKKRLNASASEQRHPCDRRPFEQQPKTAMDTIYQPSETNSTPGTAAFLKLSKDRLLADPDKQRTRALTGRSDKDIFFPPSKNSHGKEISSNPKSSHAKVPIRGSGASHHFNRKSNFQDRCVVQEVCQLTSNTVGAELLGMEAENNEENIDLAESEDGKQKPASMKKKLNRSVATLDGSSDNCPSSTERGTKELQKNISRDCQKSDSPSPAGCEPGITNAPVAGTNERRNSNSGSQREKGKRKADKHDKRDDEKRFVKNVAEQGACIDFEHASPNETASGKSSTQSHKRDSQLKDAIVALGESLKELQESAEKAKGESEDSQKSETKLDDEAPTSPVDMSVSPDKNINKTQGRRDSISGSRRSSASKHQEEKLYEQETIQKDKSISRESKVGLAGTEDRQGESLKMKRRSETDVAPTASLNKEVILSHEKHLKGANRRPSEERKPNPSSEPSKISDAQLEQEIIHKTCPIYIAKLCTNCKEIRQPQEAKSKAKKALEGNLQTLPGEQLTEENTDTKSGSRQLSRDEQTRVSQTSESKPAQRDFEKEDSVKEVNDQNWKRSSKSGSKRSSKDEGRRASQTSEGKPAKRDSLENDKSLASLSDHLREKQGLKPDSRRSSKDELIRPSETFNDKPAKHNSLTEENDLPERRGSKSGSRRSSIEEDRRASQRYENNPAKCDSLTEKKSLASLSENLAEYPGFTLEYRRSSKDKQRRQQETEDKPAKTDSVAEENDLTKMRVSKSGSRRSSEDEDKRASQTLENEPAKHDAAERDRSLASISKYFTDTLRPRLESRPSSKDEERRASQESEDNPAKPNSVIDENNQTETLDQKPEPRRSSKDEERRASQEYEGRLTKPDSVAEENHLTESQRKNPESRLSSKDEERRASQESEDKPEKLESVAEENNVTEMRVTKSGSRRSSKDEGRSMSETSEVKATKPESFTEKNDLTKTQANKPEYRRYSKEEERIASQTSENRPTKPDSVTDEIDLTEWQVRNPESRRSFKDKGRRASETLESEPAKHDTAEKDKCLEPIGDDLTETQGTKPESRRSSKDEEKSSSMLSKDKPVVSDSVPEECDLTVMQGSKPGTRRSSKGGTKSAKTDARPAQRDSSNEDYGFDSPFEFEVEQSPLLEEQINEIIATDESEEPVCLQDGYESQLVEQESLRKKKESLRKKQESAFEEQRGQAENKESLPDTQQSRPEEQESLPEKKESTPYKQKSRIEVQESLPGKQEKGLEAVQAYEADSRDQQDSCKESHSEKTGNQKELASKLLSEDSSTAACALGCKQGLTETKESELPDDVASAEATNHELGDTAHPAVADENDKSNEKLPESPLEIRHSAEKSETQQIGALASSDTTETSSKMQPDRSMSSIDAEVERCDGGERADSHGQSKSTEQKEPFASDSVVDPAYGKSVRSNAPPHIKADTVQSTANQQKADNQVPQIERASFKAPPDNESDNKGTQQNDRERRVQSLAHRFREAARECAGLRLDREAVLHEMEAVKFDLRMATTSAQERRTELTQARRELEIREERIRQLTEVNTRSEKETGNLRSQLVDMRRQLESAESSFQAELSRSQRYRAQLANLEAQLDSRTHELTSVTNALIEKRRVEEDLLARVQQLQRGLASSDETVRRLTQQLTAEQTRAREILLAERSRLRQQQQHILRSKRHCSLVSPTQLSKDSSPIASREAKPEVTARIEQRMAEIDARIDRLMTEAKKRMCRHQQQKQQQQEEQKKPSERRRSSQQHIAEDAMTSLQQRAAVLESSNKQLIQDVQSLRYLCSDLLQVRHELKLRSPPTPANQPASLPSPVQNELQRYLLETERLRCLIHRQLRQPGASDHGCRESSQQHQQPQSISDELNSQLEAVNQRWHAVQQTMRTPDASDNPAGEPLDRDEQANDSNALLEPSGCRQQKRANDQ